MRYRTSVVTIFAGITIVIGAYFAFSVAYGLMLILFGVILGGWAAQRKLVTKERAHGPWISGCIVVGCTLAARYEFIDGRQGLVFWSMIVVIIGIIAYQINAILSRRRKRQLLEFATGQNMSR